MATIPVKDANNTTVDLEKPLPPGRALAASSRPVALSNEDLAALEAIADAVTGGGGGGGGDVTITDSDLSEYETVAASVSNQAMGTGATGDYLAGVLIVPATTSPGAVSIKDGAGSAITIFTGGASSVSNLVPFFVPLGIKSTAGAWQISTGAAVSAIGVGAFT